MTLGLITVSMMFTSCQFNQSASKDLVTGAVSRGNGIGCETISMEVNGRKDRRNSFVYGETVNIVFDGITGLIKEEGKTYPGLSLHIVKDEKDTVMAYPNLLEELEAGADLPALQLQANFTAALPYRGNEKYKAYIRIWDRKGNGSFSYEVPFTVTDAGLLDIKSTAIDYSNIYLWNESLASPVVDKAIDPGHTILLILEGITGLKETKGKVFPALSISLVDNEWNTILSNPNLFSEYVSTGADTIDVKKQVSAVINFQKGRTKNPCRLKAVLKDQRSEKQMVISAELKIK